MPLELIGKFELGGGPASPKNKTRYGDYITTITGQKVYPLDAYQDEIVIFDVAHALSRICRWNGHVEEHFSVGHHTLLCVDIVESLNGNELDQLQALHHDDSEYAICDIPKPIKPYLKGYKRHEKKLQKTILKSFGIPIPNKKAYKIVEMADVAMLHNEALSLTRHHDWADPAYFNPYIKFHNYTMDYVREKWLETHHRLYQACLSKGLI